MSRFFRILRPLCISFGVASTVPTNNDAPAYVQDAFKKFNQGYQLKTTSQNIIQKPHVDNKQDIEFEEEVEEEVEEEIEEEDESPISTLFNPSQYLSRFIDHTVLKPKSSEDDIRKMCAEAIKYDFYSVCCNPCWVSLCNELLKDSKVKICCVVGFPLGSNTTQIKLLEAQQAVKDGADEIDMVMNIGRAKSGNWDFVKEDIAMVVLGVADDIAVKVILETCLLTDDEVIEACRCAVHAGAKFVKTSTGFSGGGATAHHVGLMRKCVDEEGVNLGMEIGSVLVKASGGIRDTEKAKEMLRAGADRIGASSGINIIGAHHTTSNTEQY